jgi:LacI family transcriptional regulator
VLNKKTNIEDIARQAGVCIGTVSRVINNKGLVHPKTRERIRGIIEKTGYHPSAIGRALVLRQTHTVMLQLHNIADPHCVNLAKRVSQLCRSKGYKMVVGDADYDPAVEMESLQVVQDGSIDGLLVSPLTSPRTLQLYKNLADSGFPVIALMDPVPGTTIPCVKYDDIAAGRMAAEYLLEKGHRHIIYATWQVEFQTVKDRYQGYVDSHRARGLSVREELHCHLPHSLDQVQAPLAATLSLKPSPTAIIALNEMVALACLNALTRLNRRVPQDVALLMFGDLLPQGASVIPITSVALSENELVERAVQLLFERIEQRGNPKPRAAVLETLQPHLVVRDSA